MTAGFVRPVAPVRRGKAWVKVACSGTIANRCVGTLVLRAGGTARKAAFSVRRGKRRIVRIPLGAHLLSKLAAAREEGEGLQARLFARTSQTSGSPVITSRLIRLK
jgi:hypothetical protein